MRISEMHPVERPRERLEALGPQALKDAELLALVLRCGYKGRSALDLARTLLKNFPDGGLTRLPMRELSRLKGVGPGRASVMISAWELSRRWNRPGAERGILDDPRRVWDALHELRRERREHFVAFCLDACNRLIRRETVSIGTLTASLVHPREVFAPAVEGRAASVIVAHNHPSGELRPSREDGETTRRIARAGRILGIPLLDHVIVAQRGYFSFRKEGLLR